MAAPLGNQNAVKGRRWSKAIERAVDAWPERAISLEINKGLDKMAYEFVARMVETKDIAFYREFGDRIDGKAPQAIVGDDELPPVIRGVVTLVKPDEPQGEGE
jgi:hypothetical protein